MSVNFLFWVLCGIYFLGWVFFCLAFFQVKSGAQRWGNGVYILGLACHVGFTAFSAIEISDFVVSSLSGLLLFLSLLSVVIYFILNFWNPNRVFGLIFPPLSLFSLLLSAVIDDLKIISPSFLDSAVSLNKIALYIHASCTMIAYLLFFIAGLMAIFFLYQENRIKKKKPDLEPGSLPSLGILRTINERVISVGFVIFSVGLLLGVGMVILTERRASMLSIRQALPLLTWVMYMIFLIDRSLNGQRGRISAIWSIVAGLTAVLSFVYEINLLTTAG